MNFSIDFLVGDALEMKELIVNQQSIHHVASGLTNLIYIGGKLTKHDMIATTCKLLI